MISREHKIRVRYSETDQMGYLHNSRYAQYYEVSRTEMIRELIGSYRVIEENGLMLPLLGLDCKFMHPALYDDVLSVTTILKEIPSVKMQFFFEVRNEEGILLNTGSTTLVFVDKGTRKPVRAPKEFRDRIETYFEKESV